MAEQRYEISWYDTSVEGDIAYLVVESEKERNKKMQQLINEGFSPTHKILPSNMTEADRLSLYNDVIKVFTLTTNINSMRILKGNTVDCVANLKHDYVFGVEVILFNEFIINQTHFPNSGILNVDPIYPDNVEAILYSAIIEKLDTVGFDYERGKKMYEDGEFEISVLLNF